MIRNDRLLLLLNIRRQRRRRHNIGILCMTIRNATTFAGFVTTSSTTAEG